MQESSSDDGACADVTAGVVQFFHGLGLGLVLGALFQENFLDVSGAQVRNSIYLK